MILLEMILGYFGIPIAVMIWLITALATWRVFQKADIPGWKALIPIYREYNIFLLAWEKKQFFIYLAAAVISAVLEFAADRAGDMSIWGAAGAALNLIVIYYEVMMKMYLSRSFGRSRAFGLFLYFLEPIALSSLGFGPYDYEGPVGKSEA